MQAIPFTEITNRINKFQFPEHDLVIGLGTGGVVPASLVANIKKSALIIITYSYRDNNNTPMYEEPLLKSKLPDIESKIKILIVDDVSVTGKTLNAAKKTFKNHPVKTFVLKGQADYVLFPEIKECVKWPWKEYV